MGDMDFKVCGTKDGITACQMDIKVNGLSSEIMAEAFPDEDYDGFGWAQRYLKWAFIDDDLSNFVFPDPEKEIYKRRLESLKSKRRKNKDENSDNELIFDNEEDEDYENSEFDEYDDEDDDYDYDEEEDEEDEEDED